MNSYSLPKKIFNLKVLPTVTFSLFLPISYLEIVKKVFY